MHRPRVLLVQRVLAHYRLKVFEALASRSAFDIDFAFGDPHRNSSIESVAVPQTLRAIRLRNLYVGEREVVSYQAGLSRLLLAGGYDVVIAEFNPRILSNVIACFRRPRRTRFIWWGHGIGPNTGAMALRIRTRLAAMSDAVIFYDGRQADRFITLGLPPDKAYVAPNSIDVSGIVKLRSGLAIGQRSTLLSIGRLVPEKRVDVLLRAYASVRPHLPMDSKVVIIGDGPEREMLTSLSRQLGISDKVEFAGAIYQDEALAEHFNSAWASVCMGKVGLNAIHSLAFGVPMIAARDAKHAPEVAALRDGETAAFTDTADPSQVAKAILSLREDEERLALMSRACKKLVESDYGLDAMADVFERAILATA